MARLGRAIPHRPLITLAVLPYAVTGSGAASFSVTAAGGGASDGIGSGSASFNVTAAGGGKADVTGSGAASFNVTAAAGGKADITGSGAASFNFTATGVLVATTTIYPNGDGTIGEWTDQAGGTTNLWATVDEPTASPNDADYIKCGPVPSTVFLLLTDMPGDFSSMGGTIVVKVRGRRTSSSAGYMEFGAIRIVESDETTALTDTSTPTTTTSLAVYTLTLNVTGATTKTAWDGARLKIPTNSGNVGEVQVTAIQVDVTYNSGGSTPGYGTNQNASIFLAM